MFGLRTFGPKPDRVNYLAPQWSDDRHIGITDGRKIKYEDEEIYVGMALMSNYMKIQQSFQKLFWEGGQMVLATS
jgi:hypothetical protein